VKSVETVLTIEKELNFYSRVTREIMLGGDLDKNLALLNSELKTINGLFSTLASLSLDTEDKLLISQAKEKTMFFLKAARDLMNVLREPKESREEIYKTYHNNFSPIAKSSRVLMKKVVKNELEQSKKATVQFENRISTWTKLAIISAIFGIIILIILTGFISSQIKSSLSITENGLKNFFDYLNLLQKDVKILPNLGKDEFGHMSRMINENIQRIKGQFANRKKAITEFDTLCIEASKGFLFHRINTDYNEKDLNNMSSSLIIK